MKISRAASRNLVRLHSSVTGLFGGRLLTVYTAMFMRSGRKLDKTLTSLFKFDKNTSASLDRLVAELHANKELCSYQFLNHPGSEDMLAGILKLVHSKDRRFVCKRLCLHILARVPELARLTLLKLLFKRVLKE